MVVFIEHVPQTVLSDFEVTSDLKSAHTHTHTHTHTHARSLMWVHRDPIWRIKAEKGNVSIY
jgi:hypothetical protein